jgi:uncharacterized protein
LAGVEGRERQEKGRLIRARVVTRSSRPGIESANDGSLRIYVASPPEKGRANKEVIEIVARHFGVSKSRVTIKRGSARRDKLIFIDQ